MSIFSTIFSAFNTIEDAGEYTDIKEIKEAGKKGRSAFSTFVRVFLAALTISIFSNGFLVVKLINRPNREDWQTRVDDKIGEITRLTKEIDFWKAQADEWKYYAVKGLREIQPQVAQTKETLDSMLVNKKQ